MCGICGIVGKGSEKRQLLGSMCALLQHRGPDHNGSFFDENIGLGHQRLSIIDLVSGDQPIYNEDRSIVLVYNGEMYNFKDFRTKLIAKGHQFATRTDAEILVHAYEEYGTNFIKDLNGIFAFALYDRRNKRLLLVRDHFGVKPLHYWHNGSTFVFASEQKALLIHPEITREINYNALHCQINLRYTQSEETLFKNIFRLPPGHFLLYEDNKMQIQRYYYLPVDLNYNYKKNDLLEAIRFHINHAIKRQLISDVPIGVYLSGGMDSSTIVTMMHQLKVERINTFTLGFNEKTDEFPDAALVAETFGTHHHTASLAFDPLRQLPEVIRYAEEPKINLLQGFNMSAMVSPTYKVILGGLGGDELFAGYDINRFINLPRPLFALMPLKLQQVLLEPLSRILFCIQNSTKTLKYDEYRRGLQMLLSIGNLQKYYLILRNVWDYDRLFYREIYHPAIHIEQLMPVSTYFSPLFAEASDLPLLDAIAYVEFHSKMVNDYLLVDDRMSMAHSVELRVPFLDKDLVEFMFTVPMSLKMKGTTTKHLFRKAMQPFLPEQIIKKKKWGFAVNPYEQFKKDLKTVSQHILTKKFVEQQGIFNYTYLRRILDYPPHPNLRWHYNFLWIVLGLAIWQKMFIESDGFMDKSFHIEDYYSL
jgi:asparagine synthase (glutamine-hydrolysing)